MSPLNLRTYTGQFVYLSTQIYFLCLIACLPALKYVSMKDMVAKGFCLIILRCLTGVA